MTTKAKTAKTATAAPEAPVTTPVAAPLPALYTTFHVAHKFNMRPVELRRVLRSMPEYADGVHTAYRWQSIDDSDVQMTRIAQAIGLRGQQRQAAAARAQAALAAAQATQAAVAQAAAAVTAPPKKK